MSEAAATNATSERRAPGAFYPRLAELEPPALFVWGSHDRLIPPAFERVVRRWLPSAEHLVQQGCGHVPQVERADQVNGILRRFLGGRAAPARLAA
jgi:pimeloyl-ACP methyl ester carboxylesterase